MKDRRKSVSTERPSCSFHQPTISLEASTPKGSLDQPTVVIETPRQYRQNSELKSTSFLIPKASRSFDGPPKSVQEKPTRMSVSLDANPPQTFEKEMPLTEEEEAESPVVITLDESQITAPLLESLKSSDV